MDLPKYCPECRAEYTHLGVTCSDCHVPLVWDLPPEETREPAKLVAIMRAEGARSIFDLMTARALLDGAGIAHVVQEWPSDGAIELLVASEAAEEARKVLADSTPSEPESE